MELREQFIRERTHLRNFINDYGIKRVPKGSRELLSWDGKGYYPWQFYLRETMLISRHLSFIANCFWRLYGPRFVKRSFQIAGVESGASPIITAIIIAGARFGINVNAFMIRKERKSYGLCNVIEGRPSNLPVVIIDELTSPIHETMWIALNTVLQNNLKLYGSAFVVVFKGVPGNMPYQIPTSQGPVTIESLYTLKDFDLDYEDYEKKRQENKAVTPRF